MRIQMLILGFKELKYNVIVIWIEKLTRIIEDWKASLVFHFWGCHVYKAIWNPLIGGKCDCDYFWYISLKALSSSSMKVFIILEIKVFVVQFYSLFL